MSKQQRRSFTRDTKKEIVEAYLSKRKTLDQLEKEFDISRYQIFRWREQLVARAVEAGANPNGHLMPTSQLSANSQSIDPRDQLIIELKLQLADKMLQIERLNSQVNGGRRFQDRVTAYQEGLENKNLIR